MRDGVDESVVLFVAADFANEECCIENQAKDDCQKKDYAQYEKCHLSPVEQNPTDIQGNCERNQASAQCDEERYRFTSTTSNPHGWILKDS
jgi:hypothetical protein